MLALVLSIRYKIFLYKSKKLALRLMLDNWTDGIPPVVSNIMILFYVTVVYKWFIFNIVKSLQLHTVKQKFTYFIKNGSVWDFGIPQRSVEKIPYCCLDMTSAGLFKIISLCRYRIHQTKFVVKSPGADGDSSTRLSKISWESCLFALMGLELPLTLGQDSWRMLLPFTSNRGIDPRRKSH